MNIFQRFPIAAVALLAACGTRDAGQQAGDTTATPTTTTPAASSVSDTTITGATYAPALNVDLAAMTRTPAGAYYRDVAVGNGAVVEAGKTVAIHYVGTLANGTQFDANQPPRPPYAFRVSSGEVIPGFDEGVTGMRQGGRRQVVIPPQLGYGPADYGPIPGGSVLVFTIEVVRVQ